MADPIEPPTQTDFDTESSLSATEVFNSIKVSLADLCAKGTAHYARKNYDEASDLFARASELQAELNGEMSPENAEILFLYGRSLFRVGQSKSDVLGGRASGEGKKKLNGSAKAKKGEESEPDMITEEGIAIVAEQNGGAKTEEDAGAKKPFFQFTGDENFEDSDDDEAEGKEGEGEAEEEEDDLAAAFEVLDLARVLYTKKLEVSEEEEGKGKAVGASPMTKHLKERLADTHDLLAEISLENERFPGAVTDFRAALVLKEQLHPEESEIIAEAHFKLSLALEFASITRTTEGDESRMDEAVADVDQGMRDEAVKELELAVKSTKLKLQNKEVELASSHSPDENDITRAQITDVKEMVVDMEARLSELQRPPVDVKDVLYGATSGTNPVGGILGATLGESPTEAAARIEEAKKTANDLTGLVRRKVKLEASTPEPSTNTKGMNGKRKAQDESEHSDAKKAKIDDALKE